MRSYEGEDEEKEEDVDDEGDDDDGTGGPRVDRRGNVMVECVVGSKGAARGLLGSSLEASWGAVLGPLGVLLGPLEGFLEASWRPLGGI